MAGVPSSTWWVVYCLHGRLQDGTILLSALAGTDLSLNYYLAGDTGSFYVRESEV